jgi:hypothetical protein
MLIGSYAWDHNRWERALINSSCKLSSIDSGFRQAHKPTSDEDGLDNLRHACYFTRKPSLFVIRTKARARAAQPHGGTSRSRREVLDRTTNQRP